MRDVVVQARAHNVETYLCGITVESMPYIPVYLHLGIHTFSVEPAALLPLKKLLMEQELDPASGEP